MRVSPVLETDVVANLMADLAASQRRSRRPIRVGTKMGGGLSQCVNLSDKQVPVSSFLVPDNP